MSFWINRVFAQYPPSEIECDGCLCPSDAFSGFVPGLFVGGFVGFVIAAVFYFKARKDYHRKIEQIFVNKKAELNRKWQLPSVLLAKEVGELFDSIEIEIKKALKLK